MIKLVAFDLDGTIGNTIPMCISAFKKAVAPYTRHELSEKEIIRTFGLNEEGMIRQVAGQNWEKALDDFYLHYAQMHEMCPHPFEGIVNLIQKLKRNSLLTALITGKGEKSCSITLHQFGMNHCFDAIETGSPYKNRKSEAIRNILEQFHLQPDGILYIGDTASDVLACKEAGVQCLSAAWAPNILSEELLSVNAGNIVNSISGLEKRFQSMGILPPEQ